MIHFIFSVQAPPSRRSRQQVAVADPPMMSATDYDEDGSCIICYEDMIDFDSSRLNCGHRFHTEVNNWKFNFIAIACNDSLTYL